MKSKCLYVSTLVLAFVLMSWLLWIMPPICDDFRFMIQGADAMSWGERFVAACGQVREAFFTDVFRLPNQTPSFLVNVVPDWLRIPILSGSLLLMLEGGRRAMRLDTDNGLTYMWILAAMLVLPWYDYMMATSYFINYVPVSAMVLWVLYFALDDRHLGFGRRGFAALGVLAFCTGWSHEAFAIPLIGLLTVCFVGRYKTVKNIPRRDKWLWGLLAAGSSLNFISPVLWMRVQESVDSTQRRPVWEIVMQAAPELLALAVFAVICLFCLRRDRQSRVAALGTAVALVLSAMIVLNFYNGPRTIWAMVLLTLWGGFYILNRASENFWRKPAVFAVCCAAGIGGMSVNLAAAIVEQPRYTAEYERVIAAYTAPDNTTGEVFVDVSQPRFTPALLKTSVRSLNERTPLGCISRYYSEGRPRLQLLPARLRAYRGFDCDAVEGDSLVVYDNMPIVATTDPDAYLNRRRQLTLTTTGGTVESRYRASRFHALDGREYILLTPHAVVLDPTLRITGAQVR